MNEKQNLFNAWFPELKEVGDGNKYRLYGYEAYTTLWYAVSSEELYNYFNSQSEKVIIRECAKNRKAKIAKMREACRSDLDNPSLIPRYRDRYPSFRDLYIKKKRGH